MFRNLRKKTIKILNWKKKSKIIFFLAALVLFLPFIPLYFQIFLWKTNFCLSTVGLSMLGSAKKNFFSDFECYDLTIDEAF